MSKTNPWPTLGVANCLNKFELLDSLTEEECRVEFRSVRPEFVEMYTQISDRNSGYLARWIE